MDVSGNFLPDCRLALLSSLQGAWTSGIQGINTIDVVADTLYQSSRLQRHYFAGDDKYPNRHRPNGQSIQHRNTSMVCPRPCKSNLPPETNSPNSPRPSIFFLGMSINISSDAHLRTIRRRKGKTGEYVLPEWGLFKSIVSPNYLGEVIEWTGFAIVLGRLSGWVFVLWTVCNLAPRARSHLEWYKERFGERVGNRSGIIPGV